MNIKETFLKLTSRTYPHGYEAELFHLLPKNLETDEFGNLYKQIGENPSTMFACHLDTATSVLTEVTHVEEGNIIKTDGTTILGADDKAGVTILMYMMENKVPGLYYFFLGEEVGCVGSKKVSAKHSEKKLENITKVVSFDRRGTTSIITHQCSSRCCSDEFGDALANALNSAGAEVCDNDAVLSFKKDPTGLYTDSAQFTKIYPECTNISVGYQSEHTWNEQQDIKHLEKLAKAAILVDWESLPISRDPSKVEYSSYGSYGSWYEDDDFYYKYGYSNRNKVVDYNENVWVYDEEYGRYVSCIVVNKLSKRVVSVDISLERIAYETDLISELMMVLDVEYKSLTWTGFKLVIEYSHLHKTECDRNDLVEYIPELNFWKELSEDSTFDTFTTQSQSKSQNSNDDIFDETGYPLNYD